MKTVIIIYFCVIIAFIIVISICIITNSIRKQKLNNELNKKEFYLIKTRNELREIAKENAIKQAEQDKQQRKQYFETHQRNSYGLVCPANYYNIYYLDTGAKLEMPIINGFNMTPPPNTVHMSLGVKKEYTYENCEDCMYWNIFCKRMKEQFENK